MNRLIGIMGAAAIAAAMPAAAADVWVDINGAGDGSSELSPTSGWMAAMSNAAEGGTVHVRGGDGRVYAVTSPSAVSLAAANVTLKGWGDEKPRFTFANGVAAGLPNGAVFSLSAPGITLEGLRMEVSATTFTTGRRLIYLGEPANSPAQMPSGITVRDCEFIAPSGGLGTGSSSNRGQLFYSPASGTPASGFRVEDCFFANFTAEYPGSSAIFWLRADAPLFANNAFTNCARILMQGGNNALAGIEFRSNIVMSCASSNIGANNWASDWSVFAAQQNGYQMGNVHHNIFIGTSGANRVSLFEGRGNYEGAFQNMEFNNNTLVDFGPAFALGQVKDYQNQFSVEVFANLVVDTSSPQSVGTYGLMVCAASVTNDATCYDSWTVVEKNYLAGNVSIYYDINEDREPNFIIEGNYTNGTSVAGVAFRSIDLADWRKPKFCRPGPACDVEIRDGGYG